MVTRKKILGFTIRAGEPLDQQGIPTRLTKHLNQKTNRFKPPKNLRGEEQKTQECSMCTETMDWDKEIGYYLCNNCTYSQSYLTKTSVLTYKNNR